MFGVPAARPTFMVSLPRQTSGGTESKRRIRVSRCPKKILTCLAQVTRSTVLTRPRQGKEEALLCRGEQDRQAACFKIARPGTRKNRATADTGSICPEPGGNRRRCRWGAVQLAPLLVNVSGNTSTHPGSIVSSRSNKTRLLARRSANRPNGGFNQLPFDGVGLRSPQRFSIGAIRSISGFFLISAKGC